jgi:hypothetical protein
MLKRSRFFDIILIVTFLTGLTIPLMLTHNREVSSIEKRKLKPFPEMNWDRKILATFPLQFESFFNDHFGFRDNFAQLYYILSWRLKSSPYPNVFIGQDDWLFYVNPDDGNSLEDYRRNDPLTASELKQWRTVLEAKNAWLNQQGIHYLFVVSPDKQSIYGEYFPARIRQVGEQTRLDQFMEYMSDSEVPILDLRSALLDAKSDGLVYYKTNTHWNDFGAAVAQNAIMQQIAKCYPTVYLSEYSIEDFSLAPHTGDIANMLNLTSQIREMAPHLIEKPQRCDKTILEEQIEYPDRSTFFTDCFDKGPHILFFRDSFFESIEPFISPHLSKSLYVWIYPDFNQLEQFLEYLPADMVIEERVERLLTIIPDLPSSQSKDYHAFFENCYQKGSTVYKLSNHNELTGFYQLTDKSDEQQYKLLSLGTDPQFELPEFKREDTLQYIMKVELKVSKSTTWQVFYSTSEQLQYNEKNSISGLLMPGENTFYVLLDDDNLQGKIRIDPGTVEGEYLIKSLEIRSIIR